MNRLAVPILSVVSAAFAQVAWAPCALAGPHDVLIAKHAVANGVPEQLVRRVIRIESRGNPAIVHAGNYGLMQIRLGTARAIGYVGDAAGLLDPDTNLTYAVKYLAGAYRAAGCDANRAVWYYQRGYYGTTKHKCAEFSAEVVQVAQAETKPADVLKPKTVRTETIATAKSGPAPARPVGAFEPARVSAQPAEATDSTPANSASRAKADANSASMAKADADSASMAKTDKLAPVAAKLELAAVPLPPARPELEPSAKHDAQPPHRSRRVHERTGKTAKVATIGDPVGVVTFLKNLVTPDKKPRKRTARAKADPPSQVQMPQ
jgi:hypothetical protein